MTKAKHIDEAGRSSVKPEDLPRPRFEDPIGRKPRLSPRIREQENVDKNLAKLISEGSRREELRPGIEDTIASSRPRLSPSVEKRLAKLISEGPGKGNPPHGVENPISISRPRLSPSIEKKLAKLISEGPGKGNPPHSVADPTEENPRLTSRISEDDDFEKELTRLVTKGALPPSYLAALKKQWIREHYDEEELQIPPALALTWNDIPSRTDPETGETTYEINSGKYDENGEPNPEHLVLNEPLPANATIIVHNPNGTTVTYKTDDQGRVVSAETKNLEIVPDEAKLRDSNQTQETKNQKDGKPGDDGGHLIGDQFGGCSEQINLVPMSVEVNRSVFKKVENTMAKAVKEGKNVTDVKVEVTYEGDSKRPTGFKVSYKIDGKPYTTVIPHN